MSKPKILKFRETQGFSKWRKFFPQEAVSHPAKMNLNLLNYLIQHYTEEGDTLLDPMSGTGSTGILAGLNGRNAICIDLEQKFHEMQVGVDCDGYTCHVLGCYQRHDLESKIEYLENELKNIDIEPILEELKNIEREYLRADEDNPGCSYIDEEVMSPDLLQRYEELDMVRSKHLELYDAKGRYEKLPLKPHHYKGCDELYKANPEGFIERGKIIFLRGDARKLSDLLKEHKEEISACLFSPPYKTANEGGGLNKKPPGTFRGVLKDHSFKLSENPDQIDNMSYGDVDDIITSPPFAATISKYAGAKSPYKFIGESCKAVRGYSDSEENIGNLPLDVIITSPPYSEGIGYSQGERAGRDMVGKESFVGYYGDGSKENIGNLKHGEIDSIITSPPYAESTAFKDIDFMKMITDDQSLKIRRREVKGHYRSPEAELQVLERMERGKIEHEENIGNLPFCSPDAIITSPPYSEGTGHGRGKDESLQTEKRLYLHGAGSYSETNGNIGEIKEHGDIDVVLTSPPYAESVNAPNDPQKRAERMQRAGLDPKTIVGGQARCGQIDWAYSTNAQNIGNLKHDESEKGDRSETYLEAMRKVYAECYSVLKPHGLMILVVKNFIRNKQVVPLTEHTIKLCESVGFSLKERLLFKLPQQSFWRILYSKKYPEVDVSDLQFEHVLIFEKG